MEESNKKKAQLLKELADARKRISELEKSETVRKIAEESLQETERLYREIYTIAPLAFVIWDMNCRITDWNKRAEEVFGWTREEVLGRNFFEFLIPERAQIRVETAVEALLQKELPNRQINENLTKSGKIILCEWNNSIRYDNAGRVIGAISLGLDITERKRAEDALKEAKDQLEKRVEERTEELKKKNEELEMVTYFVSHDLQAPLRTIEGFSQMLIEDLGEQLKGEHREDLMALGRAAENMHELIGDMMIYARLGIQDFSKNQISLKNVFNDSQFELIEDIKKRGASILVSESLPVVKGHERTLVRLLTNLLSNAIKFVPPERRPEVCIEAERSVSGVRVSVRDNGIGIAPEYREKIFNMFERLHSRHEYPGTGVGLAIVKKAAELHGGTVGVESEYGKGSTFWFEIPD